MAGNGHNTTLMDPALIKWNKMMVNRHKYFRWTKRTAWITFAYVILVPSMLGTAGYMTEGKYDFRGKRRGDLLVEY